MDPRITDKVAQLSKETIAEILVHFAESARCYIPGKPGSDLSLAEVCLMAVEYMNSYEQPTPHEDIVDKFKVGTRWKHCGCEYEVVMNIPFGKGTIVLQSLNCKETFLEYSTKQMEKIQDSFKKINFHKPKSVRRHKRA